MANLVEVKVPDIGDFTEIPVIEILVKPGDTVKKEDSLVSLESDKATMEVEAVDEGTVTELLVEEGAQGVKVNTPIATLAGEGEAAKPAKKEEALQAKAQPSPLWGGQGGGAGGAPSGENTAVTPPPTPPTRGGG